MNILDRIEDVLIGLLDLADFIAHYGNRQTRRLLRFELELSIFMVGVFAFGMIEGWELMVVSSAFFMSILGLFIWKEAEIALNVLAALAGVKLEPDNRYLKAAAKPITAPIKLAQGALGLAVEEARNILMPLLTTSLAISFVASYVSIKGLDYFNLKDLMIYSTVILFLAIYFWAYLELKTKIAGKVMFAWLIWLIAAHYLWPVQIQGVAEVIGNKTINMVTGWVNKNRNGKIINVSANALLYQFDHGNLELLRESGKNTLRRVKKDIKVKLIGRKKAPNSGETLYRVILPVEEGVYIGGEEVYVPAMMTSPEEMKYFIDDEDGGFRKITFLSDGPVVVLKNWQAGQRIKISGYGNDAVYFRDGSRLAKIPVDGIMTSLINQPLEITYKKGGVIYINY